MKETIITTSWDDGSICDLKLANLLKKYNIPATFYIPIKADFINVLDPVKIRDISKNFDIGGHTYNHQHLTEVSRRIASKEIVESKKKLEDIIGRKTELFSYPGGVWNGEIIELTKKAGFKGARTIERFKTSIDDPYKMGITSHVYNHGALSQIKQLIGSGEEGLIFNLIGELLLNKDWAETSLLTLKECIKEGGIWHLFGHSWEIEKYDFWEGLEALFREIKKISKRENLMLLDNTQVIEYFFY